MSSPPSSRNSSTLLLVVAYLAFISLGLPDTLVGVAWPFVRDHFTLQQSQLGWIFAATSTGYCLSSFFTGSFMRRLGVGPLLAASTALVALAGFGFSSAPVWALFLLCATCHGLGSGAIDGALNHHAAAHFPARHMNWLHACYGIGATFGPIIMTSMIVGQGSWRAGYLAVGTLLFLQALLFLTTRRLWGDSASDESHTQGLSIAATLRHRLVWLHILAFFLYTGLEVVLGQWSFTVLTESRKMPVETAGACVTAYWASIALGRVLFGFIVERVRVDHLVRGCLLLALAGVGTFAFSTSTALSATGLVLAGLGLAPIFPCLMTQTPERLGKALSFHAIGFQVSAAMIGAAALPGLAGVLAQHHGLQIIPLTAATLAAVLLILHTVMTRTRMPSTATEVTADQPS
ncbi:MAG: MFS transporter [Verrucomicrobiota bacterium]